MTGRLLVVALCLNGAAAYTVVRPPTAVAPHAASLNSLPLQLAGWRGANDPPLDRATLDVLQVDAYVLRTYERPGEAVGLYVAFYATQQAGHTIHSPLNCLPGNGWEALDRRRVALPVGTGRSIEVNREVVQHGDDRQVLYYWYQGHGRTVASEYWSRLWLVHDAVVLHRSDGALVRVARPIHGSTEAADVSARAFVEALYPILTAHLPG